MCVETQEKRISFILKLTVKNVKMKEGDHNHNTLIIRPWPQFYFIFFCSLSLNIPI